MQMKSIAKKTTTMARTEGIQMITVNTPLSTTTEQEEKQTMQMKKIQVLVMMKSNHMRGAIAMRNHIIVIANQSMHMILTIQEGVIPNTEHNQTTMLESQVKQASVPTATVKMKKRNSASSNS